MACGGAGGVARARSGGLGLIPRFGRGILPAPFNNQPAQGGITMKKCVLLLSLFALSVSATADDGFYVTGSVGGAFLWAVDGVDDDLFNEDSDITFGGGGGYRFGEYWAVEAGYRKLGSFGISGVDDAGDRVSVEADFQGFTLGGAVFFPVADQISVHGKLGAYIWDSDLVIEVEGTTTRIEDFEGLDDNGEMVYVGGGVLYHFTDQLSIGGEYMSYFEDGDHIGTFTAIVNYYF